MTIASEIKRVEKGCNKKNHFIIDNILFQGKEKCGYYIPNTNTLFFCEGCKIKLETLKFAQSEMESELKKQRETILYELMNEYENILKNIKILPISNLQHTEQANYLSGIQACLNIIYDKIEELTTQSQQVNVVGKPMKPSTQNVSEQTASVTADNNNQEADQEVKL